MHEASIVLSTIAIVKEEMRKHHISTIHSVTMCVGELACVEEHTLKAFFQTAVENSALANAELTIETVPKLFRCDCCKASTPTTEAGLKCPECADGNLRLEKGRELYVKSFEAD